MLCMVLGFDFFLKNHEGGKPSIDGDYDDDSNPFRNTMCQKPLHILNHVFSQQLCGGGTIIILILRRGLGETLEGTRWRVASRRSDRRAMLTRQSTAHHATVKAPG